VEEQFYLVWPLVFAGACWSQRRRLRDLPGPRRRLVLVVVFGVTLVASLALSISLTASGSTWAFFGLPSRAWEFAVAGLLAVVPVPSFLRPVHARTALAAGGLVVLAAGCGLIDDGTRYPGLWALLPVGGTVLLIVAGETWDGTTAANPVSRLLTLAPLQWLGRVSYSWYLWHWPAIVLVVVAVEDDATSVKTAAALASLPVAWLAYRWFETPLRYSSLIARSHRRTYLAGALATIGVLAVAVGVRSTAPPAADPGLGLAGVSAPPGSSLEDRVAFQVALYRDRSNNSCPLTGGIETPAGDLYCVAGDPNGTRSVMLMGDSHAGQWRRVLDDVAKARGIKLLIRQHNGCAPFTILLDDVEPGVGGGEHAVGCRYMQTGNPRILEDLRPDAIIVGNYAGNGARVLDTDDTLAPRDRQIELWGDAVADLIGEAQQRDIEVGWILDAPKLGRNASSCIVAEQNIEACVPTRDEGFKLSRDVLEAERAALDAAGVEAVLDLPALICDEQVCNLEIDGDLVYVDEHHLTDEFAAAQRQRVDELVQQLLGP